MITLKNYILQLQEILDKIPNSSEMPVIYAVDEEGNDFKYVQLLPTVNSIKEDNFGNIEFVSNGELNCIIVN